MRSAICSRWLEWELRRDERRAKADLETLIDASPLAVVVFDAKTGATGIAPSILTVDSTIFEMWLGLPPRP